MEAQGEGMIISPMMREEIIRIVDQRIREVNVTREDFSELKSIVRDIAEAQKRTEKRVEELAEAQKRTEKRVEELAEAQKKTEKRVEELAEAQKKTEEVVRRLATKVGELDDKYYGISRSMGYAFENEAYRKLPNTLKERYGIELRDKMIRRHIGGREINILGFGKMGEREVVIVGEAKTRLDRVDGFRQLDKAVEAVSGEYEGKEIVKVIVTHFATKEMLKRAEREGVIVVQSFEWI